MRSVDPGETNVRTLASVLHRLTRQREGNVTLTPNAIATTVIDKTITEISAIGLMPKTANAAAAIPTTYVVSAVGSFVINHANNVQTDRDFRWAVMGIG